MTEDLTWLRCAVAVLVAMVLQYVVLDQIVVFGSHPDLMIVCALTAGIAGGPELGAFVGFGAGFAADLIEPTPFGMSMVAFVLVGYGAGALVASPLGREFATARIATATLGSALATGWYGLVATVAGRAGVLQLHLFVTMAVAAAGALVLSPCCYLTWRWAFRTSTRALGATQRMPSAGSALRS